MPSQKAMLSSALAKASTAVQLDNAQYHSGARKYYAEACELLQQIIARASNEEDRKKLDGIRVRYILRIRQLDALLPEEP
ncbi:Uu.00g068790.m01.CDS01 [Anthostomella pinea]|uniref:Uu.00g068790.m01.CDS01 n=1 Tax=Anthostomella pinea TaxID=933095 RepID=A0AAI8YND7_9PEZI|nr:Uu.00g068790.m01.CDS01 [Anthostomella pinea]